MRENLLKAFITTSVLWIYPIETAFLTKMPGQTVKSGTQTLASQELGSRFGQLAGFRAFSTDDKDLTNLNRIAELGESQKNLANQENENKNSLFSPLQTKYKKYSENLPAVKNGEYGSKDFFNAPLSRQAGLTAANDGDNVVKLGINKKGRLQLFVGGSENLNTESFKEQIRASALRNKHYYLPRFKFAEDAFADMPIGDGLADLLKDFDHVNMRQEEDAWYNLEIRSHMEKAMKELKELKKLYPDTSYANYKDFQLKEVDKVEIDSKVAVAAAELKAALSGIAKLDDRRFIPPMLEKSFYIKKNFKTINFLIEKKLISPSDALRWFREDDTLKILAYHFDKEIDVSPTQHWLPTKDAFLKDHRNLGASLSGKKSF
ncbi:hypothetical protein PPACK8108_LOCUS355 [Phakopsora pachyrhizi]|uniref:Uncharacterized protein n=1 Tax=Phakopsora pachyrhizi TaxID=170000 RepID=A0AAV0AEQ5_PHAPC|nr:hypothetical protein PPACK8108_LOCUS355 [Phakopsora pachyrhizi]